MSGNSTINCEACKRDFTVTEDQKKFYQKMKWTLPVRCYNCRTFRKDFFRTSSTLRKISRKFSIYDSESIEKLKKSLG